MDDCAKSSKENFFLLQCLPTEVLFHIFQLCDVTSLGRLARTCRRFNGIISDDFFWQEKSKNVIIANQQCESLRRRTYNILVPKEICRVSENWKRGSYKEIIHKSQVARFMPWLLLEKDYLWLSQGSCIMRLKRTQHSLTTEHSSTVYTDQKDVCRFVKRDDHLICGTRDGLLCGWSTNNNTRLFFHRFAHTKDVCAVDCGDSVILSGGADCQLKIWPRTSMHNSSDCSYTENIGDKILCVSISPCGQLFCVGTTAIRKAAPLHLFDLQTQTKLAALPREWKKGAGILDVTWVDNHLFLTGSYDTSVRMWDVRLQDAVMMWENPYDSAVYCLRSDGENAIVSGLAHHCCMQLWDKRVANRLVQIYYARNTCSPVYCLAFDSSFLFCALDQTMRSFNFAGRSNKSKNYVVCLGKSVPAREREPYITRSAQNTPLSPLKEKDCNFS